MTVQLTKTRGRSAFGVTAFMEEETPARTPPSI